MSRSRRPRKLAKCCCGRHLIPGPGTDERGYFGCPHPCAEDMERRHRRWASYRDAKRRLIVEA